MFVKVPVKLLSRDVVIPCFVVFRLDHSVGSPAQYGNALCKIIVQHVGVGAGNILYCKTSAVIGYV